jgi:hypothetical protein
MIVLGTEKVVVWKFTDIDHDQCRLFVYEAQPHSLSVSPSGTHLFYLVVSTTRVRLFQLRASDLEPIGYLNDTQGIAWTQTEFSPDEDYLFLSILTDSNERKLCRWAIGTNSTYDWIDHGGLAHFLNLIVFDNNEIFVSFSNPAYDSRYLYRVDITSGAYVWTKSITWPVVGPCSTRFGAATLQSSGNALFLLEYFNQHFLFYSVNPLDGNPLLTGNIHHDTFGGGEVNSVKESNGKVFLSYKNTNNILLVYNLTTHAFDFQYSFDFSKMIFIDMLVTSQNFVYLAGQDVTLDALRLYKSYYTASSTIPFAGIYSGVFTSVSPGNYELDSGPNSNLNPSSPAISFYTSAFSTGEQSLLTSPSSIITNSVWNEDFHIPDLTEDNYFQPSFIWTCSPTGVADIIVYSLVSIEGDAVPGWVTMNSATRTLEFDTTPSVLAPTVYKFGIQSDWGSGYSAIKKFYVTVNPCAVSDWTRCQVQDENYWSDWDIGYINNSGVWNIIPPTPPPTPTPTGSNIPEQSISEGVDSTDSTETTITQIIVATAAAISLGAALIMMSSPQGAFSMLNLFQLYILLPMIGAYLPPRVIKIILGLDFSLVSFSFLQIEKIPLITNMFNFIDYDQSDDYFDELGLTSGSALLNHIPLILILGVLVLYHLSILPCFRATKSLKEGNWVRWIVQKLFEMMTFSIYVRVMLESYLYIWISTVSEINQFDVSTGFKQISLGWWFLFLLSLASMVIIWGQQVIKAHPFLDIKKQWWLREFFIGLKNKTLCRLFFLFFMISRIFFVVLVIVFKDASLIGKILMFSMIQFVVTTYTVVCRPFDAIWDTMIEMMNQLIYLAAVSLLVHFKHKTDWDDVIENVYVYMIISGPIIGLVISIVNFIVSGYKRVLKFVAQDEKVYAKPKQTGTNIYTISFSHFHDRYFYSTELSRRRI